MSATIAAPRLDRGRAALTWRLPGTRVGGRLDVRTSVVVAVLLVAACVIGAVGLMIGDTPIAPDALLALAQGHGNRAVRFLVVEWALPRFLAALLIGALLGIAGALFQTITRNPLGSPDVLGFSTGAYTGGIVAILVLGTSVVSTSVGAVVGGALTAVVVLSLSVRRGLDRGRIIVVGIAVTAMLSAVNSWLILRATLELAYVASAWGAGTLAGQSWSTLRETALLSVPVLLATAFVARWVAQLDLGDDTASSLGVPPSLVRVLGSAVGVLCVGIATAAAGPIAFVALAAPQIGRRLVAAAGTPVLPAAATGAFLLPAADVIAQHGVPGMQFPVGVVTVVVGGLYLVYLLSARRKGSAR